MVAHIFYLVEHCEVVAHAFKLVFEAVGCFVVNVEGVFVGGESVFAVGRCQIVVAPAYCAEVEHCCAHFEVADIHHGAEVEGCAVACYAKFLDINVVDAHVACLFAYRGGVLQIFYAGLHFGIGHHVPRVFA